MNKTLHNMAATAALIALIACNHQQNVQQNNLPVLEKKKAIDSVRNNINRLISNIKELEEILFVYDSKNLKTPTGLVIYEEINDPSDIIINYLYFFPNSHFKVRGENSEDIDKGKWYLKNDTIYYTSPEIYGGTMQKLSFGELIENSKFYSSGKSFFILRRMTESEIENNNIDFNKK
jgi:hypothetical protein